MTKLHSIKAEYANKNIFIAGASGFIGKVYLTYLLDKLPEVNQIYVLMRPGKKETAKVRFKNMLNASYVFENLHEKYEFALSSMISKKVKVLEGDLSKPKLGLSDIEYLELQNSVELFVNTAGNVDFFPRIDEAFQANVEGPLNLWKLCEASKNGKMLHVSTAFVAGKQSGRIQEQIWIEETPSGMRWDPEEEYHLIERIKKELQKEADQTFSEPLEKRIWIKEQLKNLGKKRSKKWGWTNTYTYSKALAESLLALKSKGKNFACFRPAIVESAYQYPFPGWNDGFNTSGPLVHLLSTWFKSLPARPKNRFDAIPVDLVCKGMIIAGAELLMGDHEEVYHCGSSDLNPITMRNIVKYTSQSHQSRYRVKGKNWIQRHVRSKWAAKCIGKTPHPLSVQAMNRFLKMSQNALNAIFKSLNMQDSSLAKKWVRSLSKKQAKMLQIESLIELFIPFIRDHRLIFECKNLKAKVWEEKEFAFDIESLDWKDYWINIHIPGLYRWSIPAILRQKVAEYHPKKEVHFSEESLRNQEQR